MAILQLALSGLMGWYLVDLNLNSRQVIFVILGFAFAYADLPIY